MRTIPNSRHRDPWRVSSLIVTLPVMALGRSASDTPAPRATKAATVATPHHTSGAAPCSIHRYHGASAHRPHRDLLQHTTGAHGSRALLDREVRDPCQPVPTVQKESALVRAR